MRNIVIIGNGISGVTSARHIRKRSDDRITIISGESDYFYSRTALMYIFMGHMKQEHTQPYEKHFWKKNRIELKRAWVKRIDFEGRTLHCSDGSAVTYDVLILALGARPNKFGWPGQDLKGVSGMVSLQDLECIEGYTKGIARAAVVGGGLIGVELAEMLHSRGINVSFIVRELRFWDRVLPAEEAEMISNRIIAHGIDLRLKTEFSEILGDANGRVRAVVTGEGEEIPCAFCGLTVGVHPNIGFLADTPLETDKGILVDEYLETNIPSVYAVGDCAQHRRPLPNRPEVEQVWYTGRMQGETVAATVCGNKTAYRPGNWFNSAKLFDIEYQVYSKPVFTPGDEYEHFFWKNEEGTKSVRIACEKGSDRVIYISTLGVRFRHEVCNRWIEEGRSADYVLAHLREANFDPEFYPTFETEIQHAFHNKRDVRESA
ncbi:MAG: NAD(P)/FAD-dependent oxidoreductase [Flavobacteriales bacterium]